MRYTLSSCINRIRLEFKVQPAKTKGMWYAVLIESDWNLKYEARKVKLELDEVLIESDWNLKEVAATYLGMDKGVLIESDWNLKVLFLLLCPA